MSGIGIKPTLSCVSCGVGDTGEFRGTRTIMKLLFNGDYRTDDGTSGGNVTSDTGWGHERREVVMRQRTRIRSWSSCGAASDSRQIVVNTSAGGGGTRKRNKAIIILSVLILLVNYCNGLSATVDQDDATKTTDIVVAASITGEMSNVLDDEDAEEAQSYFQGMLQGIKLIFQGMCVGS